MFDSGVRFDSGAGLDSGAQRAQRVLGVDPGLSRCGVAVLRGPRQRARVAHSDVVRTAADSPHGARLATIHAALDAAIRATEPAALAVERVFINSQARTGIGAVQVVGLVHLLGAAHDLPVAEYTPSQVKAAVTGVGDADKVQVTYMVQRLLRLQQAPTPADRADAMAVALCHLDHATTGSGGPRAGGTGAGGMSPRLAAALAAAGPGLSAVRDPRGSGP